MSYRIAICDDNPQDAAFVQNILDRWSAERGAELRVEHFPSAESFLFRYEEDKEWDILLLDIEMGEMDGVSMAKEVRRSNETVQIVFITGYSDYIAEGYEVAALHYLMKPVKEDKLCAVLDRALEKHKQNERCLNLELSGEMVRLPVSAIRYVEAFAHSASIVTESKTLSVKQSISELEQQLGTDFVRCHRSYLVRLKHIARLSKNEVIFDSSKSLPLSRGAAQ